MAQLPSLPGVYLFEDDNHKPLYIGKSINVRSRIGQHLEGYKTGSTKAHLFIPQTKYLTVKVVTNDIEAIILESNYIKASLPKYNSISKDDKSHIYIVFTNPPDTKIKIIHATDIRTLDLDNYKIQIYGPYSSSKIANALLKQIKYIFGYCLAPLNARNRSCFNRHLDHCPGICDNNISSTEYQRHLGKIKKFLSGRFISLKKQLNTQIKKHSKTLQFEKANLAKTELIGLETALSIKTSSLLLGVSDDNESLTKSMLKVLEQTKIDKPPQRMECYDLAHIQGESYVGSMVVFENFGPQTSEYRHFEVNLPDRSDPHAMRQIISRRFNHPEWRKPDLIILDGGLPQLSIVSPVVPPDITIITLAKKRETIMFYDQDKKVQSINLKLSDPVLALFMRIRDEAHRFANSYHRRHRIAKVITKGT